MTRWLNGGAIGGLLAIAPIVTSPLGRLGPPMTLVIVLPVLALALEAFGWRDRIAAELLRVRLGARRAVLAYGLWLGTSATLSLDVAAVLATSVGLAASRSTLERRWQLGAAILGSNLGSLLLPYSNLTNLVVASAAGVAFGTYVGVAILPQVVAALVGGIVLARRIRSQESEQDVDDMPSSVPLRDRGATWEELAALLVAVTASAAAAVVGLLGGDLAVPFAFAAAILGGAAVAGGRLRAIRLGHSIPLGGIAVILAAAAFLGPAGAIGAAFPVPSTDALGLAGLCLVGGALAMTLNNLPAAAFGAVWLVGASPTAVVAYLIGTNFACLATPHGSIATILARSVAARAGHPAPIGTYLSGAWRFAAATTAAALGALNLAR